MTEVPEHLLRHAKAHMQIPDHLKGFRERNADKFQAIKDYLEKVGAAPVVNEPSKKEPSKRGEEGFRSFKMLRRGDESGVSGVGVVLEGVVFTCGTTVIHWLTPAPKGSISIWDSFDMFKEIHIDSHPSNNTMLIWGDGTTWSQDGEDSSSA